MVKQSAQTNERTNRRTDKRTSHKHKDLPKLSSGKGIETQHSDIQKWVRQIGFNYTKVTKIATKL